MNKFTFIATPSFTSLLSEISKNAKKGRIFEKEENEEDKDQSPPEDIQSEPQQDGGEEAVPSPEAADDETSSPTPEPADTASEVNDANADADLAQAELEKAKARKGAAEEELKQQGYIKLVSPGGTTALLQMVIDPAIKTNQLDSLANSLVKKLAIDDPEQFKQFKDDTIEFRGIVGFNQLVQSMEKFIGQSNANPTP